MAANLGFRVTLAHDACAAFETNSDTHFDGGPAYTADTVHRTAISHLHGEFAMARSTLSILQFLQLPEMEAGRKENCR